MEAISESRSVYGSRVVTRLINSDGSENRVAIEAEIRRRCDKQEAERGWANRPYHERHVLQDVCAQRWPLIEAEIRREWSPGERKAYQEALAAASSQSIDGAGNERYDALVRRARIIQESVQARAIAAFHRRIGQ